MRINFQEHCRGVDEAVTISVFIYPATPTVSGFNRTETDNSGLLCV